MANIYTELRSKLIKSVTAAIDKELERLWVCEAPDCERAFLKNTKGKYCSQKCQSRVFMRAYRASK